MKFWVWVSQFQHFSRITSSWNHRMNISNSKVVRCKPRIKKASWNNFYRKNCNCEMKTRDSEFMSCYFYFFSFTILTFFPKNWSLHAIPILFIAILSLCLAIQTFFIFRNFEWTSHNSDWFPEIFWVCNFHFSAFGILNFSSCNSNISFLSYNLQDVHLHFKNVEFAKLQTQKHPQKCWNCEIKTWNSEFRACNLNLSPPHNSDFFSDIWSLNVIGILSLHLGFAKFRGQSVIVRWKLRILSLLLKKNLQNVGFCTGKIGIVR